MDRLTRHFKEPKLPQPHSIDSSVIHEYQANLKIFLQKVEEEVSGLIQKYETQIKELKKQNSYLKMKLEKYQDANPEDLPLNSRLKFDNVSPVKVQKNAKTSPQKYKLFQTAPKKYSSTGYKTFKSYLEYEAQDLSSSRFQVEKNRKKIRQQNLLATLEAGKNNLSLNTSKLYDLLGKNSTKTQNQQQMQEDENHEVKSTQERNEIMNTSLSSVCQSLDNSFHGKKSKKKNQLKRKQKDRIKAMRLQEAKKNYKQKKQQGLKNLLKTIRQNVISLEQKPLQSIKTIRIAYSGYENETSSPSNESKDHKNPKSKVLIDPNPIDITKSRAKLSFTESPQKPHSILKQNSTILSKSILD